MCNLENALFTQRRGKDPQGPHTEALVSWFNPIRARMHLCVRDHNIVNILDRTASGCVHWVSGKTGDFSVFST